jgi:hypothetical protein
MASGTRLHTRNLMMAVHGMGNHRSDADNDDLRRRTTVTVGSTDERERKTDKKTRRCTRSPETHSCARRIQRRTEAAKIEEFHRRCCRRNGEFAIDWSYPGSIPSGRMMRTTRRISWYLRHGEGASMAAALWRVEEVLWGFLPRLLTQKGKKEEGKRDGGA